MSLTPAEREEFRKLVQGAIARGEAVVISKDPAPGADIATVAEARGRSNCTGGRSAHVMTVTEIPAPVLTEAMHRIRVREIEEILHYDSKAREYLGLPKHPRGTLRTFCRTNNLSLQRFKNFLRARRRIM